MGRRLVARRAHHLVILGPQGSGKGTQAEALGRILGVCHIASGDLIRSEIRAGTPRGLKAQSNTSTGTLVPDSLVLELVGEALAHADAWILDGFPRTAAQAEALDGMLATDHSSIDAVIALEAPDSALIERIGGRIESQSTGNDYHVLYNPPPPSDPGPFIKRADDTPEAIARRLSIYHSQTEPLETYYDRRGLLRRIDAAGSVDDVTNAIITALNA
jgi:adenylate kinase